LLGTLASASAEAAVDGDAVDDDVLALEQPATAIPATAVARAAPASRRRTRRGPWGLGAT
jgi:hypothetical protein